MRPRTRSRSGGGCGGFETLERPAQQPRHGHLRVADPLADQVREVRLTFQEAMAEEFTRGLAERVGRQVVAYSQLTLEPDIGFEFFVLEDEPPSPSSSPRSPRPSTLAVQAAKSGRSAGGA